MNINIKEVLAKHPPVYHPCEEGEVGFWVEVPDFPGCVSEGDTIEEAQAMIEEAAYGWILSMNDCGFPIVNAPELNRFRSLELVH